MTGDLSNSNAPVRLFHLTFYKCGSQWVRDILADPRIAEHSGHRLVAGGIDLQSERWPPVAPGEIGSPLYSTGTGEWREVAQPDYRAFVVIRDPRDIVVSLVYSVSLSHTPTAITLLLRNPIADADPANRLQIGMFLLAQWESYLRTWRNAGEFSNVYCTRYETLIADLAGELRRLFAFLGWTVPDEVIDAVAAENTFRNRSGREPGQENEFSHRRKGIAGDWRNHFDRARGELFESAFPGLLTDLGYEDSNDWWRQLPEAPPVKLDDPSKQRSKLLAVLEEHEKELAEVRVAAEDRLRDIHILHDAVHGLQRTNRVLEDNVASLRAALEGQDRERRTLEESFAWRYGFRPLRALLSIFRP